MNDREMLEKLEWVHTGVNRWCPSCRRYKVEDHAVDCILNLHLHPEAVEGSAEWADAQGRAGEGVEATSTEHPHFQLQPRWYSCGRWHYGDGSDAEPPTAYGLGWLWCIVAQLPPEPVQGSGKWADAEAEKTKGDDTRGVRLPLWPPHQFAFINAAGKWRFRTGGGKDAGYIGVAPSERTTWELYAPPEPETVRWWAVYQGRARSCNHNDWPAHELAAGRSREGYILQHFVGHTADGVEVEMGTLLKVWLSDDGRVGFYQGLQFYQPVWATHAVMERVAQ